MYCLEKGLLPTCDAAVAGFLQAQSLTRGAFRLLFCNVGILGDELEKYVTCICRQVETCCVGVFKSDTTK